MSRESQIVKDSLKRSKLLDVFKRVESKFSNEEVLLVGGAVRDAFLGAEIHDLDFSTPLKPDEILKVLDGEKLRTQGITFGTVTWIIDGLEIEITSFRCDETYENYRQPEQLKFGDSKLEDLKRRDFTINAMMYSSNSGFYDPLRGLKDLESRTLKAVGDPHKRFKEDALRVLRLYRFYLNYGFKVDEDTLKASEKASHLIDKLSKERVFLEFKKTFSKRVHLKNLKWIFKNFFDCVLDLEQDIGSKKFNVYEQMYCCKLIKAEIEKYLYEKSYKKVFDLYTALEEAGDLKDYQSYIINFIKKNNLKNDEAFDLWNMAKHFGEEHSSKIEAFNGKSVESAVFEKLRALHSGKALGEKLFEEELKSYFTNK